VLASGSASVFTNHRSTPHARPGLGVDGVTTTDVVGAVDEPPQPHVASRNKPTDTVLRRFLQVVSKPRSAIRQDLSLSYRATHAETAENTSLAQSAQRSQRKDGADHPPSAARSRRKEGGRCHFVSAVSAISSRDTYSLRPRRGTFARVARHGERAMSGSPGPLTTHPLYRRSARQPERLAREGAGRVESVATKFSHRSVMRGPGSGSAAHGSTTAGGNYPKEPEQ
jgi:hypothetical protein